MASTTFNHLEWNDRHTLYLNQLYTLYHDGISWHHQLCDIGYGGHPDPLYEGEAGTYTPDFVAYGESGDIQHIDVKGFENIAQHFEGDEEKIADKIESRISDLQKYQEITDEMVSDYLAQKGEDVDVLCHEIVALVPYEVYADFKATIESTVNDNGIILWLIDANGESEIWKAVGEHTIDELNDELNNRLKAYPNGKDLIQFTRDTQEEIKKYKFLEKLLKYCSREKQREFEFDEVDEIMTSVRPPLLSHLPKWEREEIWREYLYSLLHHLEVLEHGEGENQYKWKKKRFTTETRDRKQILSKAKSQLDLD